MSTFIISPLPAGEVDTGAAFVHADGCEPFESIPGAVSEQVGGRVLSVRAHVHFAGPGRFAFRVDRA